MGPRRAQPAVAVVHQVWRATPPLDRLQRPTGFVDLFSTARVNSDSALTRTNLGSAGCDGLDLDRKRRFMSQICGLYLVRRRRRMPPSLNYIARLPVSHVWFGDYSALYLELGELKPGKQRKDGTAGNPFGQITVYAGYSWRLERAGVVYSGKANTTDDRHKVATAVKNSTITTASTVGGTLDLQVEFSNGFWLVTFDETEGDPEWSVSFNTGREHLCVSEGRLHVDRRDA
jgi:hypothetical protein